MIEWTFTQHSLDVCSGSDDLTDTRCGWEQRKLDIEADLQSLGDGCELAHGGVAAAGLERGDDGLGDFHAVSQS
jgi:hypothetical protein